MATRSEEIEREIEQTRADMSRTVGAIERRLSPDGMMDNAVSWFRTSPRGRAIMDDVTEVVARNPLPVVLIGIGLGWLAWEMTNGGRRRVRGYRPMRDRLGPDFPVERHHMHVEDGGHSASGGSPDPEDLVGYRRGTESARDAAEAFRDMDQGRYDGTGGATATGPDRYGRASGASRFVEDPLAGGHYHGEDEDEGTSPYRSTKTASSTPSGSPQGGYGPSVTGPAAGASGKAEGGSPDPQRLTGYQRSGESASDAAKAFEDKDRDRT